MCEERGREVKVLGLSWRSCHLYSLLIERKSYWEDHVTSTYLIRCGILHGLEDERLLAEQHGLCCTVEYLVPIAMPSSVP